MSDAARWHDVKARARRIDPSWDDAERAARRRHLREQMLASIAAAQPAGDRADDPPRPDLT
ncbi:hypothetical protein AB0N38_23835 [Micromonospora aurantiaca]|uniref:Uncharacterized protein n=1 Tax=Micromonospora aurantiaca (nom. illeg.) TaxID=47850 RepID=A0ABQ6UMF9_9ACTN|nr:MULTISPECIES: hypothetical protein [Micromonospora]KAB1117995.1 hypothetical protein F6X54_05375 [Micromonospora aurantiaca]MBC9003137.1 hypothetical protein [Micromonospora aurantiaca]MDG4756029.1 hypothetical protein [Micromonospora sp. WMMD718]UFN95399.1 hypothetical protein LF814_04340 [Micromonospora aurantiaca]